MYVLMYVYRLHDPWSDLKEFVDSIDLQNADDVTHRHIPYGAGTLDALSVQGLCMWLHFPAVHAGHLSLQICGA